MGLAELGVKIDFERLSLSWCDTRLWRASTLVVSCGASRRQPFGDTEQLRIGLQDPDHVFQVGGGLCGFIDHTLKPAGLGSVLPEKVASIWWVRLKRQVSMSASCARSSPVLIRLLSID